MKNDEANQSRVILEKMYHKDDRNILDDNAKFILQMEMLGVLCDVVQGLALEVRYKNMYGGV